MKGAPGPDGQKGHQGAEGPEGPPGEQGTQGKIIAYLMLFTSIFCSRLFHLSISLQFSLRIQIQPNVVAKGPGG